MLNIDKIETDELHKLQRAVAYLFSPDNAKNLQFIRNLEENAVKKAYRNKARRYHPDLHQNDTPEMIERRLERFKNIQQSYKFILKFMDAGGNGEYEFTPGKTITIAVGGAKGGIGKSIFAINLGVYLSSKGKKVVIADFDLGGANVHLYLGEMILRKKINDYIGNPSADISDFIMDSKYGPKLLGGDSSQLGAANIKFGTKLKLMRAVKQIDADYIIIDLGGDTSFNIIDFFNSADRQIVVTTEDPASYLEAYRFIKVSLYRKINRLFGVESEFRKQKDKELQQLIYESTIAKSDRHVKTIHALLDRVREEMPLKYSFLQEVISAFNPFLVVNRVPPDASANKIANHIQDVARKMLAIDVMYLGKISHQKEVEQSARELMPAVAKDPDGKTASEIAFIAEGLLK
ncbi:P-loop NTPase [candidate division KSB1 bacterium]